MWVIKRLAHTFTFFVLLFRSGFKCTPTLNTFKHVTSTRLYRPGGLEFGQSHFG